MFAAYFDRWLSRLGPGSRLLEVGCARSRWLPYFAKRYPVEVAGLDYSEPGCAAEREVLRRAGVSGEVVEADLFEPPARLLGSFDLVLSLGVVEHFEDTAGCLAAVARLARPGGTVITTVPNMTAAMGALQRAMSREVYEMHVPLDAPQLAVAHRSAGLAVEASGYLMSTNFGVVNLGGNEGGARGFAHLQLTRVSKIAWAVERRLGRPLPAVRALSPYVVCCARRPS